jgi:hypothetical protein
MLKLRFEDEINTLKNIIHYLNINYSDNETVIKQNRIKISQLHKTSLQTTLLENNNKEIKEKIELFHKTISALNEVLLMGIK